MLSDPTCPKLFDSTKRVRSVSMTAMPRQDSSACMGDSVFIRNFSQQYPQPTWLSGEIVSVCGPVSYTVRLSDHRTVRRHVDHIRRRPPTQPSDRPSTPPSDSNASSDHPNSAEFDSCTDVYDDLGLPSPVVVPVHVPAPAPQLRRSSRLKRPPDRYQA